MFSLNKISESIKNTDWKLLAFSGLALKSIMIGVGFPEAFMFLGILGVNCYEQILREKKRISNVESIEERMKNLESKVNASTLLRR